LRRDKANKIYDACVYQITIKDHAWKTGKIIVRFTNLVDIDARVTAGTSVSNSSKAVIQNNATASVNKEYAVDLANGATTMFITALPKEDSTTAAFEMQYWVDGAMNSDGE